MKARPPRVLLLGGLLLFLLTGCVTKTDWEVLQRRSSIPAGDLFAGHTVAQTFIPTHDGLNGVEVVLVDYAGSGRPAAPLELLLCQDLACAEPLAQTTLSPEEVWHNRSYGFRFPPQPASAGQTYLLLARVPQADTPARATLWAHSADLYEQGALFYDGQLLPGDLTFWAYYEMTTAQVAGALWEKGWAGRGHLPALLLLLLAPGYLLARLLPRRKEDDPLVLLGLTLGLSVAVVPLLLLLSSRFPWRLNGIAVRLAGGGIGLLAAGLFFRDLRTGRQRGLGRRMAPLLVAMAALCAIGLGLRAVHALDLVAPPWIDAVHHTLLARLIVERGAIPADYFPYVEVAPATYHFGFQSLVAVFHWLTDMPLPDALLLLGQVLSGLAGLPLYALGRRWGKSRWAGLVAAAVPSALSLLPAYLISWSRYTQLAGLFLLPTAIFLLERLLDRPGEGRTLLLTAVAAAGLLLCHLRVAAFFAALAGLLLLGATARRLYQGRSPGPLWRFTLLAALVALLLTWPWLWPSVRALWLPAARTWPAQTDVLTLTYVRFGPGRYLVPPALAGAFLGLLYRRRHALALLAWTATLVLMANPHLWGIGPGGELDRLLPWFHGLRIGAVVDNLSVDISLYLPLSLGIALGAGALPPLARRLDRRAWPWLRWAGVLLLVNLSLWGADDLAGVVNARTTLLARSDLEAMAWIEEHTPADALFLIDAYEWLPDVYAGSDGGYWISPLTGRRTWPPPALYGLGTAAYMEKINQVSEQAAQAEGETLSALLRENGITHVYLGRYGGTLTADKFIGQPGFRLAYQGGGVRIWEVKNAPSE